MTVNDHISNMKFFIENTSNKDTNLNYDINQELDNIWQWNIIFINLNVIIINVNF